MEILFEGTCPHCANHSSFLIPSAGQTIGSLIKFGVMIGSDVWSRQNPLSRYVGDDGELGRCAKCNEVVLKCPKCDHINRRFYEDNVCCECGKAFIHP